MTSQNIERLLREGDKRTVGNVALVVEKAGNDTESFAAIFDLIFHEESAIQMRAADTLVKIAQQYPEMLQPYKERILNELTLLNHQEVNWHTAQMLGILKLTKKESEKAIGVLKRFLQHKSSILRTFVLQAMCDIAQKHPLYKEETISIITKATESGTPAMKARGRMLLKVLKK